jgi:hypothetical protein
VQLGRWTLSIFVAATCSQLTIQALAQTAMLEGSALYREPSADSIEQTTVEPSKAPPAGSPSYDYRSSGVTRPATNVRLQGTAAQHPAPASTHPIPSTGAERPHTVYLKDTRTFWQRHPMVKGAAIGAGFGAGAGALTGLISGQGILRGAVIGAGTGAGVGVIRTSKIMKQHPIARDVATGAASGLGVGWAGSRRPGIALAGTGIGAAIGLGTGLFTHLR